MRTRQNIEQYVGDYRFLEREKIHTIPQLEQCISDTKAEISFWKERRSKADNTAAERIRKELSQAAKDKRGNHRKKYTPLRKR